MKRILLLTAALFSIATATFSMSYEQARQQALFLTDKMAYELNLTEEQYEAAYEVNFDYLLGVNTQDELYGIYWQQRNLDLSYILLDWQYNAFVAASYFYRPLYWSAGFWHFGIYARYPHRDYFYFGHPRFFDSYRGGHCWRENGGRSWYHGRSFVNDHNGSRHDKDNHQGMRDGFRRGDFGTGRRNSSTNNGQPNNSRNSLNTRKMEQRGTLDRTSGQSTLRQENTQRERQSTSKFGSRRSSTRTTANTSNTNATKQSNATKGINSRKMTNSPSRSVSTSRQMSKSPSVNRSSMSTGRMNSTRSQVSRSTSRPASSGGSHATSHGGRR